MASRGPGIFLWKPPFQTLADRQPKNAKQNNIAGGLPLYMEIHGYVNISQAPSNKSGIVVEDMNGLEASLSR